MKNKLENLFAPNDLENICDKDVIIEEYTKILYNYR